MKHARPKGSKFSHDERIHKTDADYRKKYFGDEHADEFDKRIASAGYKTRSIDSYIPKSQYEPKSRKPVSEKASETKKIDTNAVRSAQKNRGKKRGNSKSKKSPLKRGLRKILPSLGILLLVLMIVGGGVLVGMYTAVSNELKDMNVENLAYNYSSFIYCNDADGNAKEYVQLHFEGERRIWVDSEEISQYLKDAAVSIEDERFYKHNGVDIGRTLGATLKWGLSKIHIGSASYGGSTLTQQLVKNITSEKDKTATRKIKEMMRAIALEKQINDKDEILTMYLNVSFFANQCNGVEAASNLYFGKHASDVSIAEAATIVGITQRPTYYNPIKNPENATKKRNVVLGKMHDLGYITDEEYEEAKNSPLKLAKSSNDVKRTIYSYFVDQVINDVKNDLVKEKGYSDSFAEQQVFSGGLKIYTTMDEEIQSVMESVYENRTGFPGSKKMQSSMVIIDPYTGEIKGMVGGAGQKTDSRGLNRATQSPRQPGSSIKPLTVYAPGIETGKLNAATILQDSKLTIGSWSPKNAYSGFKGDMVVKKAIEISANIPAVRALQMVGIDRSYDYATNRFGLKGVVEQDKSLASLGLGGLTNGVTTRDMAASYAAFANGGRYIKPYTYTKVVDSAGRVVLENKPSARRAISESTAFIMTDMLAGVVNGKSGTGKAAKLSNMPTYGKTGTTNNNYDKWFVGFTKYYVGAVWCGFDTPGNLKSAGIGNNPSCVIWKTVMEKVHKGKTPQAFTPPSTVEETTICTKTGKLASPGCSTHQTAYFTKGNAPTGYCHNSGGTIMPSDSEQQPEGAEDIIEDDGDLQVATHDDGIVRDSYTDTQTIDTGHQNNEAAPSNNAPSTDVITLD